MKYDGPENKNLIHNKLRKCREERGMSQRALAEEMRKLNIRMSRQTISRIERNERYALDFEVLGFCIVFLVRPSELIALEEVLD